MTTHLTVLDAIDLATIVAGAYNQAPVHNLDRDTIEFIADRIHEALAPTAAGVFDREFTRLAPVNK